MVETHTLVLAVASTNVAVVVLNKAAQDLKEVAAVTLVARTVDAGVPELLVGDVAPARLLQTHDLSTPNPFACSINIDL